MEKEDEEFYTTQPERNQTRQQHSHEHAMAKVLDPNRQEPDPLDKKQLTILDLQ